MKKNPTDATPLTVLTPIRPGDEADLEAHLAQLPQGEQSPFDRLSSTHFARWVIVGPLRTDYPGAPWPAPPLRMRYLLFTATFNSPVEDYVEELRTGLGADADAVWGHCVNYPGHHDAAGFRRYLRRNSLTTHQWFSAYDATVTEVRTALDLRDQHLALARRTQTMADKELRQAFIDQFGE